MTASRQSASVYRRRRAAVLFVAVVVLLTAGAVLRGGGAGAQAGLLDRVDGQQILRPGDTLWGIAARTAPSGVAPSDQLRAIIDLNGFGGGPLDAWTVVLLPAR